MSLGVRRKVRTVPGTHHSLDTLRVHKAVIEGVDGVVGVDLALPLQ